MLQVARSIAADEVFFADLEAEAPSNRIALLLAGGDGKRLQDLTREIEGRPVPKQYCRLLYGSSLLEATIARARLFAPCERITVIVNRDHMKLAAGQVRALPEPNVFIQPSNRDTGPGMLFALLRLVETHPDAIVAIFPTDHYIDDDRMFILHVLHAARLIASLPGKIAILGIPPDTPETGYGYILPGSPVAGCARAYEVQAFTEKPGLPSACDIISRGGLWNTFVMVFRISHMLDLLRELVPEEFQKLAQLRRSPEKAPDLYRNISAWNLSTRVLARIPQHLILIKVADVRWSDWGTRALVEKTYRTLNLAPSWNISRTVSNPVSG